MTQTAGIWVMSILTAAVISVAALTLTPKSTAGKAVKLCCGAMTAILLIRPIKDIDFAALSKFSQELTISGENIAAQAISDSHSIQSLIIQSEAEAYILDKASLVGISGLSVSVELTDGIAPASVTLAGNARTEHKQELGEYISRQLGIPEDRQYWVSGNENTDT